ncbi:MAG: hypothetical protein AB2614_10740 [Candidatus Thiodiazotropha endolucinida]|nr:hypothetical protein [Candidatus Thiodiazotropha taylori]MCW4250133.1 hypothetical protein [Candidatus Thiodiazotropha endolucinida]MCG7891404.1 hypothetical protein [Candidatus Thiodiazotropha taylori]MCG7953176.1 hypothetical protein [Candidatus Thiodiazotropha taylori]MCG8104514.1 hypothetical protein [Candidatus Thiodiazotropha taylori]
MKEISEVSPWYQFRGTGVPLEMRKALLGHANGDITTHYTAAERQELLITAEIIVDRSTTQTPTLTVVGRSKVFIGKLSGNEKVLAIT